MMTAEQWYECQENYKKYGLDMKPEQEEKREKSERPAMDGKDKQRLLVLIAIIGFICIGIIIINAWSASIKYSNNQLQADITALSGDVESLKIEIQSANSIDAIEEKAKNNLGMIYPEGEKYVDLANTKEPEKNFAALLKEQAYN